MEGKIILQIIYIMNYIHSVLSFVRKCSCSPSKLCTCLQNFCVPLWAFSEKKLHFCEWWMHSFSGDWKSSGDGTFQCFLHPWGNSKVLLADAKLFWTTQTFCEQMQRYWNIIFTIVSYFFHYQVPLGVCTIEVLHLV